MFIKIGEAVVSGTITGRSKAKEKNMKEVKKKLKIKDIKDDDNFCRVFRVPAEHEFSTEFCFGGGHETNFQMIDWFNPLPGTHFKPGSEEWDMERLKDEMIPWLKGKQYVKPGERYLVLCNFDFAFTFKGE